MVNSPALCGVTVKLCVTTEETLTVDETELAGRAEVGDAANPGSLVAAECPSASRRRTSARGVTLSPSVMGSRSSEVVKVAANVGMATAKRQNSTAPPTREPRAPVVAQMVFFHNSLSILPRPVLSVDAPGASVRSPSGRRRMDNGTGFCSGENGAPDTDSARCRGKAEPSRGGSRRSVLGNRRRCGQASGMSEPAIARIKQLLATAEPAELGPGPRADVKSEAGTELRNWMPCSPKPNFRPRSSNSFARWSCSGTIISTRRTPSRKALRTPTAVSFMPSCTGANQMRGTRSTGGDGWAHHPAFPEIARRVERCW